MTPILDDPAQRLRELAAAAAPATRARADLAADVLRQARQRRRRGRWRRALLGAGCGAAVLATLAASTLLGRTDFFTVLPLSGAMKPTLALDERVILDRSAAPARGDVVLARAVFEGEEFDLLSRVIGLPGDTVACPAGPDGRCPAVEVNGAPLAEPYAAATGTAPFAAVTVPPGRMFLLGDNREIARDSRHLGPLPLEAVSGVAVRIRGVDGQVRTVPGAPPHDGPGDTDNVDPPGPKPETRATPGS
ncbi:signal peptidase I [Catellatospora sp. NPDC049609]|uniref:signal peptidase I n=1 Tax=Catellatospora sp. NPDC049609 TaxID=3155505 RepID=UPI00341B75F5